MSQLTEAAVERRSWTRYGGIGGIVFVVFLLAELVASATVPLNQDDSAAKIAGRLADHREVLVLVAGLSVVYTIGFLVYLWRLDIWLRSDDPRLSTLSTLVWTGGVLFLTLHAVSDIGINGMLGGKVATYSAHHDPGLSYVLYLLTFALDSVGDVLGSLFAAAAGILILRTGVMPRWLGWTAVAFAVLFVVQGFGLGGVIGTFGLVVDLLGWLLFLAFVVATSITMLRRSESPASS